MGEIDEIAPGKLIEDKDATKIHTPNPKTGKAENTPHGWARKQIFERTVRRINALATEAVGTRPTPEGTPNVPTLAEVKSIHAINFRINSIDQAIQTTVNTEIANLRAMLPGWTFTAEFGK
ncbi:hypothetical protein ACMHYB_56640 [Sorangium sp. So ce1128]|uniref:Uncharacterized protein n=1 Tax=Sorangium cellulosum TaxID=56 RepID=A0A3S5GY94_SORCE|nr:hypothetical protein [Sorangium cellulosum]